MKKIFKYGSQISKLLEINFKIVVFNKYLRFKNWYHKYNSALDSYVAKDVDDIYDKSYKKGIIKKLK